MAEFADVMRQARRMCNEIDDCDQCGLMTDDGCCFDMMACKLTDREIENVIMQWAEANPELRYPTWEEWQKANFPNAGANMCPLAFGIVNATPCIDASCGECTDKPIPADVAEKLGIKPIGGGENG